LIKSCILNIQCRWSIKFYNIPKKRGVFFINMLRLTKDQTVWICLEYARVNNACEVIRRWAGR
jgi:hypothetical protein